VTDVPAGPPAGLPPAPPLPPQPYQDAGAAAPIEVGFAGPAAQRRVTVLFRLILLIPQVIVLYVLGIAAEVVVVIGWFAALFTGRLPQFAADFLTGVVRWQARVSAYYLLLTDQYPPFSLYDADYPVRVVARPGPLNRLAVLFRIILVIPAAILVGLLTYGLELITMFVVWLVVLITGRMPDALHAAISSVLRYTTRYIGYFFMLTTEYPRGLYGDQPGPADLPGSQPASGFPPAAGFPPAPAKPPADGYQQGARGEDYQQVSGTDPAPAWESEAPAWESEAPAWESEAPADGQPAPPASMAPPASTAPDDTPAYGATLPPADGTPPAPGYGTPQPAGHGTEAPIYGSAGYGSAGYGPATVSTGSWLVPGGPPWRLVMSEAAKRLVTFFIVLGVVILAAYITIVTVVVINAGTGTANRATALRQTNSAFSQLSTSMTAFGSRTSACKGSKQPLPCVTAADRQAGQAFGNFAQSQGAIDMPAGSAQSAADQLVAGAGRAQRIFQQLGASTSVTQYEKTVSAANLQQVLGQIELAYRHLQTALTGG
jgi:Domain of unknown function (DUF4389)